MVHSLLFFKPKWLFKNPLKTSTQYSVFSDNCSFCPAILIGLVFVEKG